MGRATKTAKKATKKATPKKRSPKNKVVAATTLQMITECKDFLHTHFGEASARMMSELDTAIPGYIPTRSLGLDTLVGNRGIPITRILEITGPEGVGKSTIADHLMAQVQSMGGLAYLLDSENARDHRYVDQVGINRKKALKIDVDTMEVAFDMFQSILEWHVKRYPAKVGILVFDTVAGLPTEAEMDTKKNDEMYGPAKIIKARLRKLVQILKKSNWAFVAVNQEYVSTKGHQKVKVAYGGGGFPYYASIRLNVGYGEKIYRRSTDKENKIPPIGQIMWVRSLKNKVFPPLRSAPLFLKYGIGIDNYYTVFNTLVASGLIQKEGTWCSIGWPDLEKEYRKFQGHFAFGELCCECPELWTASVKAYWELEALNERK